MNDHHTVLIVKHVDPLAHVSKPVQWTQNMVRRLLREHQIRPFMYNPRFPKYRDKHARHEALKEITEILKESNPMITVEDVRKKYRNITQMVAFYMGKMRATRQQGVNRFAPTVWWWPLVGFLRNLPSLSDKKEKEETVHEEDDTTVIKVEVLDYDPSQEFQQNGNEEYQESSPEEVSESQSILSNALTKDRKDGPSEAKRKKSERYGISRADWTRNAVALLIKEYEKRPHLYDQTAPNYHNRNHRTREMEAITKCLHSINPKITVADVQKKINGIRSQYNHIHVKIKRAREAGETLEPCVWWWDLVKFLRETPTLRTFIPEANSEEFTEDENEDVGISDVSKDSSTPSQPVAKQPRHTTIDDIKESLDPTSSTVTSSTSDLPIKQPIENDAFGNVVEYYMNQLSDKKKLSLQINMLKMIYEAVYLENDD